MLDTDVGGIASMLAILLVLLTSTIILRFFARVWQQVSFGPDDWFMIPVWLCFVGTFTIGVYGMSNHTIGYKAPKDAKIVASLLPTLAEIYWVFDLLAIVGIGCVRLSALFFYRRIFDTKRSSDIFMTLTTIMIGIVILWTLGYSLLTIFQCGTSVSSIWLASGTCPSITYPFLLGWGISSFLLDLLVLALPLPKIWLLHVDIKRKLSVLVAFLLGLAGLGASCARMAIWIIIWTERVKNGPSGSSLDVFETNSQAFYYAVLEVGLAAIAVNLPSLWYFHTKIRPERILQSIRSFTSLRSSRLYFPEASHDLEKIPSKKYSTDASTVSDTHRILSKHR